MACKINSCENSILQLRTLRFREVKKIFFFREVKKNFFKHIVGKASK